VLAVGNTFGPCARLEAGIELFGQVLFSKAFECAVIPLPLQLSQRSPTQSGSAQHSTPPPTDGDGIFSVYWVTALSSRGIICWQGTLEYMVSFRADDEACSPGRVVLSLGGIRSQQPWSQS
jgi:hypothetical protein